MTAAKRPASRGGIGGGKGGDSSSTRGRSAAASKDKPSGSQKEAKRREAEEEKARRARKKANEKRRCEKEEARAAAAAAAEAAEETAEEKDDGDVTDPVIDPDTGKTVKKPPNKQKAEKDLPLASELPWHNFSLAADQESFRQAVEPVQVGKVLIARLYDAVEQFEAEAAFLIREVKDCKTGPLLGVDFVGAPKPANQIRVEVGDGEGESMIHLCQSHPECGRLKEAGSQEYSSPLGMEVGRRYAVGHEMGHCQHAPSLPEAEEEVQQSSRHRSSLVATREGAACRLR